MHQMGIPLRFIPTGDDMVMIKEIIWLSPQITMKNRRVRLSFFTHLDLLPLVDK